jgi:hypothetical protein
LIATTAAALLLTTLPALALAQFPPAGRPTRVDVAALLNLEATRAAEELAKLRAAMPQPPEPGSGRAPK